MTRAASTGSMLRSMRLDACPLTCLTGCLLAWGTAGTKSYAVKKYGALKAMQLALAVTRAEDGKLDTRFHELHACSYLHGFSEEFISFIPLINQSCRGSEIQRRRRAFLKANWSALFGLEIF